MTDQGYIRGQESKMDACQQVSWIISITISISKQVSYLISLLIAILTLYPLGRGGQIDPALVYIAPGAQN